MYVELDEDQRQEVKYALLTRRKDLEKLVEDGVKKHAPNKTAEKLLLLYQDSEVVDRDRGSRKTIPGLLAIFADEPELSTQTSAGFDRTVDSDPDLFGGGSEQGGGHPAGEVGILDRRGQVHPTREAADAANASYTEEERAARAAGQDGGIGAEPGEGTDGTSATAPSLRLLGRGEGSETGDGADDGVIPTDYEIVDDEGRGAVEQALEGDGADEPASQATGAVGALAAIDAAGYTDEGRCKVCHVFRGESHDTECPIGLAERATTDQAAADAALDQHEQLAMAAAGARPGKGPLIEPDASTRMPTGDGDL